MKKIIWFVFFSTVLSFLTGCDEGQTCDINDEDCIADMENDIAYGLKSITVVPYSMKYIPQMLGTYQPFTATGHYDDEPNVDITANVRWTLNSKVATIDKDGVIHAKKSSTEKFQAYVGTVYSELVELEITVSSVCGNTDYELIGIGNGLNSQKASNNFCIRVISKTASAPENDFWYVSTPPYGLLNEMNIFGIAGEVAGNGITYGKFVNTSSGAVNDYEAWCAELNKRFFAGRTNWRGIDETEATDLAARNPVGVYQWPDFGSGYIWTTTSGTTGKKVTVDILNSSSSEEDFSTSLPIACGSPNP